MKHKSIVDIFEAEGALQVVSGNTPFLLDDNLSCWYIRKGTIEIFSVEVEEGLPQGARHHFFSSQEGHCLFGMDIESYGMGLGFLAVGSVGTEILKLPISRLQTVANDATYTSEIAIMVDHWVAGFSHGISKDILPKPLMDVMLIPTQEIHLDDRQRTRPKKGIIWVKFISGEAMYIGMEPFSLTDETALFPLSTDTWLDAMDSLELQALDTQNAIQQPGGWEGLEKLYEVLFNCEFLNKNLVVADEYNRLQKKAENETAAKESTLSELASIVEKQVAHAFQGDLDDPLFSACWEIGWTLGVEIKAPPKSKQEDANINWLSEITRLSRLRTREVELNGAWWTKNCGPLLGYAAADNQPIALIPLAAGGYELRDPVKKEVMPVTPEVDELLSATAHSFYLPFSDKAITLIEMLRSGLRGCRDDLFMILATGVAIGLLQLVTPVMIGILFDNIIPEAERGQLLQIAFILFVIAIAGAAFTITSNIAVLRLQGKMEASTQSGLWDRLLKLPVPFFRRFSVGDLADRSMGIAEIRRLLSGATATSILAGIFSVFNFFLLFYYDASLALVAAGLTFLAVVFTFATGFLKVNYQRKVSELEGQIVGVVLQFIHGIAKLRVAGAEKLAFAHWGKLFTQQKKIESKAIVIDKYVTTFNQVFPVLTSLVIFAWIGFSTIEGGGISTGIFLAFYVAFVQFQVAAVALSESVIDILYAVPLYERAQPILTNVPEVNTFKAHPGDLSGAIEINHVSFRYDPNGPLILRDVSMQIEPGEFVAFVGPSGSGKSTLFRLILGFEEPESGSMYFDGQDLSMLDITAVRRQIGVVLQNTQLMTGDIFRNIVGSAPLTIEDAWEAAKLAGMEDDINQMPMGMHTLISEGAATFSGGQRQRLAIARAVVKKPRIMLFDEATSALDNRTQAIVSASLEQLQATRIVIAHRLSTIANADRIVVIDKGEVVQTGSYDQLIAVEGQFKELAKRQLV